jgi:hypothetical protein
VNSALDALMEGPMAFEPTENPKVPDVVKIFGPAAAVAGLVAGIAPTPQRVLYTTLAFFLVVVLGLIIHFYQRSQKPFRDSLILVIPAFIMGGVAYFLLRSPPNYVSQIPPEVFPSKGKEPSRRPPEVQSNTNKPHDRPAPPSNSPADGSGADKAAPTASDADLRDLRHAADDWRNRGSAAWPAASAVLDKITQSDQDRFTPKEQSAYTALLQVRGHFAARTSGWSQATKGQVKILIEPVSGEHVEKVTQALGENLRNAGFLLTNGPDDADVRMKVAVQDVDKLSEDLTSGWRTLAYSARLSISATWTADNSVLLSERPEGTGRDRDENEAKNAAMRDAIDHFVQQLNSMTAK